MGWKEIVSERNRKEKCGSGETIPDKICIYCCIGKYQSYRKERMFAIIFKLIKLIFLLFYIAIKRSLHHDYG